MVDEIPETETKKVGREAAKETMHFLELSEERRRHTASVTAVLCAQVSGLYETG